LGNRKLELVTFGVAEPFRRSEVGLEIGRASKQSGKGALCYDI